MSDTLIDGVELERNVLAGLKLFQRKTVDYVFKRMYEDADPARRFLVADEVGLGKTLVARGVIAKAIRRLQDSGIRRIDIIYICSNAEIAAQNVRRLNVTSQREHSHATRITLLPRYLSQLSRNSVNFVALTPGTSFNMRSRTGISEERAVIFRLLEHALQESLDRPGAYEVLRGGQSRDRFRASVSWTPRVESAAGLGLDVGLANAFRDHLFQAEHLLQGLRTQIASAESSSIPDDWWRNQFLIGQLRQVLARSCVKALEPDLVILDEFQRFRELLGEPDPNNPDDIRNLSRNLFRENDARVLLLSATPYKMYTLSDEQDENHYEDFLRTVSFLMGPDEANEFARDLKRFRETLMTIEYSDMHVLSDRKRRVENRLRRVMSRTERLSVTADRNGMLVECPMPGTQLNAPDIRAYAGVDQLSRYLRSGDVVDYWKSAPYLLNFMGDYKLKQELRSVLTTGSDQEVVRAAKLIPLVSREDVEGYKAIDPGNARMRALAEQTVGIGAWQILWLPPSLPYYRSESAYGDQTLQRMTKRLIFSSWNMVPDAVSVLLSYDAERQMMVSRDPAALNTAEERKKRRGLLSIRRQDGRPAGMTTFGLLYPSIALASMCDPLDICRELGAGSREIDASEVLVEATKRVEAALQAVVARASSGGPEDPRWYWVAPLLLDRRRSRWREATQEWMFTSVALRSSAVDDPGDDGGAWVDHVNLAKEIMDMGPGVLTGHGERSLPLGRAPRDLAVSLAKLGLGSPANCGMRSLVRVVARVSGERNLLVHPSVRDGALNIAWGFRSLFNIPEVMALLRGSRDEKDEIYWQRAAEECVAGNLQAVLDEYIHLIPDWLGMSGGTVENVVRGCADLVHNAVAIRAATYTPEEVQVRESNVALGPLPMRVRFAMRFGRDTLDDSQQLQRSTAVRSAFNSPFWPFVLASTSVGQEGLDFHQYCHAVVHWNLPLNPVDLEQREGRVHRYKGHAIRKNVAERHRASAFQRQGQDPWAEMFAAAERAVRDHKSREIEPYWIYEGSAKIERQLPILPLSREVDRLIRLRKSLAVYRLAFGQPRQEDLMAILQDRVPPDRLEELVHELRIDLSPR